MECERWAALDAEYLAGRLALPERQEFRRHAEHCDRCGELLMHAIEIRAAFAAEDAPPVPEEMNVAGPMTCAAVAQRDVIDRYIGGRLGRHEAEAFEAHYFECDACWSAVRTAEGLARDGMDGAPAPATSPPTSIVGTIRPVRRLLAAAAAAVFIAAAGIYAWSNRAPTEFGATVRGATAEIALDVQMSNDSLSVIWRTVDRAIRYRVQLFTTAGRLIEETEETEPRFTWQVPQDQALGDAYVRVEAVDHVGAVIAESSLHSIGNDL